MPSIQKETPPEIVEKLAEMGIHLADSPSLGDIKCAACKLPIQVGAQYYNVDGKARGAAEQFKGGTLHMEHAPVDWKSQADYIFTTTKRGSESYVAEVNALSRNFNDALQTLELALLNIISDEEVNRRVFLNVDECINNAVNSFKNAINAHSDMGDHIEANNCVLDAVENMVQMSKALDNVGKQLGSGESIIITGYQEGIRASTLVFHILSITECYLSGEMMEEADSKLDLAAGFSKNISTKEPNFLWNPSENITILRQAVRAMLRAHGGLENVGDKTLAAAKTLVHHLEDRLYKIFSLGRDGTTDAFTVLAETLGLLGMHNEEKGCYLNLCILYESESNYLFAKAKMGVGGKADALVNAINAKENLLIARHIMNEKIDHSTSEIPYYADLITECDKIINAAESESVRIDTGRE